MSFKERAQPFVDRVLELEGIDRQDNWVLTQSYGISNTARLMDRGLQWGGSNLANATSARPGAVFFGVIPFPPTGEVHFACVIRNSYPTLVERLQLMLQIGEQQRAAGEGNAVSDATEDEQSVSGEQEDLQYSTRNNVVTVAFRDDGKLYLRNKGFWDSLVFDTSVVGPGVVVDRIIYSVFPPTRLAQQEVIAREHVNYLKRLVGPERSYELNDTWPDDTVIPAAARRMPRTLSSEDIRNAVEALGGHYVPGLIERYHVALNHLERKHFVILTGISGTGKTGLFRRYAQAVHGISNPDENDPLAFICPVRPDWTDPSGLTGFYDVIRNLFVVPTFLQAILTAYKHDQSPVFVCIDEMNLTRPEYYLADVLSTMESGKDLVLHTMPEPVMGTTGELIPPFIPLPSNLYLVGTVNIDESTVNISDKVLDRAVVIDMSEADLPGFASMLRTRKPHLSSSIEECMPILISLYEKLKPHRLSFGYRVAEEFIHYYAYAREIGLSSIETKDELIVQKLLVKLRGGERQRTLLDELHEELSGFPLSRSVIDRFRLDLNDYGSFEFAR